MVASALFLLATIYWTGSQLSRWYSDNRLLDEGIKTEAIVYHPQDFHAGNRIAGRSIPARARIVLVWTHNGTEYRTDSAIDQDIHSGEMVPIYIDPQSPDQMTTRTEAVPLSDYLFGLVILVPAVLLTALAAVGMRQRVLSVYRTGQLRPAIVVDTRTSALTPLSRQVRCTLQDHPDKRILTVTVPNRLGVPQKGQTIQVITPPNGIAGSLAAAAYEA